MENIEKIYKFLNQKLDNPTNINNLYFSLFCTIEILPKNLNTLNVTKEVLDKVFAQLTIVKNISEFSKSDYKENYWIELIDGFLKLGIQPNLKNAQKLLKT